MMGVDTQVHHLQAGVHPSFLHPPSAQPQSTNLPAVQTAVLPPPSAVADTSASPKSGQSLVHGLFVTIPSAIIGPFLTRKYRCHGSISQVSVHSPRITLDQYVM